jgi:hypothetical protein
LDEEKSKYAGLAQKWFHLSIIAQLRWLVNGTALSVLDWPIIMIGPGGLLLVVPHQFAVPIPVLLWVRFQNSE